MSHQIERRAANRDPDDAVSPEILAVLVMCGAEIRESDRAAIAQVPDRRSQDRRRVEKRKASRLRVHARLLARPGSPVPASIFVRMHRARAPRLATLPEARHRASPIARTYFGRGLGRPASSAFNSPLRSASVTRATARPTFLVSS